MVHLHGQKMNMMRAIKFLISALILLTALAGCRKGRTVPDVSGIKVNIHIDRFEKDLFSLNLDSLDRGIAFIDSKYGTFADIFNSHIILIGNDREPGYRQLLKKYLTDFTVNQLYTKCMEVYPSLGSLETDLSQAFRYYKYYFPSKQVPRVISFVGGFNQNIVVSDSILGIALDKYLGRDCELYKLVTPPLPEYLIYNMHKGKIASDAMKGWVMGEFDLPDSLRTLMHNMVYSGKIMYLVQSMMPGIPDSILLGYTSGQLAWCLKHEKEMWTYLVEKRLLFSTDQFRIKKFTEEAPFTKDFGRESPGKAVLWIGWRIVNQYMARNPQITPSQLMEEQDYSHILELSRYDP